MSVTNGGAGRRWRGVGPALVAVACVLAVPAAAQSLGSPGLPGGAPAVADGLSLNASGEVLYDSNLLRTSSSDVIAGAAHKDDFRYSPELSATYGRSTGRLALAVNGLVGRDFFQYNRNLDRDRYQGGGSLTYHSGSSCQVAVDGNYSRRQAGIRNDGAGVDTSGIPADDVGAVIDNVLTSTTYGANAGCGSPTGRLTFGGGYVHSALNNGAPSRQFGNSDSDTYSGNVGVGILQPGQLSLNGSYTTIAYPDRGSLIVNGVQLYASGIKTYRVGLSFSRPIGTKLSGTIGLSYLHSDPVGGQSAYNSPAYTLAVNYAASQRLNFILTGSRDVLPSVTAGALFRVVDQVLFTGTYELGSSISVSANVGLIGNQYKGAFAIGGSGVEGGSEPVRHNDTTTTAGLSLSYAPRSLYDVTLDVTRSNRTSDPSLFSYTSTRASITLAIHI